MQSLDSIVGQAGAVSALRRLLDAERVPRSLLFRGPEGVGKASVARILAAALLCERARGEACGACRSCRNLERGNHPDLTSISFAPRDSDGELRKVIVIDQIREAVRLAGLAPREGRHRIFIIDPADRMNAEAQNALLKTLEEPPGHTVLILVASLPHLLLPTVASRCFGIGFSFLGTAELIRLLRQRGVGEQEARLRSALAGGRPGAALELDLESAGRRREEVLGILEALLPSRNRRLDQLSEMAAALAGKDEPVLVEGLELLQSLLRDSSRSGAGADEGAMIHLDLAPRLATLGRELGALRSAELISAIDRARGYLRFNANRTLLAESVLAAVAGGPLP